MAFSREQVTPMKTQDIYFFKFVSHSLILSFFKRLCFSHFDMSRIPNFYDDVSLQLTFFEKPILKKVSTLLSQE